MADRVHSRWPRWWRFDQKFIETAVWPAALIGPVE